MKNSHALIHFWPVNFQESEQEAGNQNRSIFAWKHISVHSSAMTSWVSKLFWMTCWSCAIVWHCLFAEQRTRDQGFDQASSELERNSHTIQSICFRFDSLNHASFIVEVETNYLCLFSAPNVDIGDFRTFWKFTGPSYLSLLPEITPCAEIVSVSDLVRLCLGSCACRFLACV